VERESSKLQEGHGFRGLIAQRCARSLNEARDDNSRKSRNRTCGFLSGIHFSGNDCRLRRSTQHSPDVYSRECEILRFFSVLDSRASRPGRAALESSWTDRCLAGSIAAIAGSCFRSCRVAKALRITEVNLHMGTYREVLVFRHLQSARSHVSERFNVDGSL